MSEIHPNLVAWLDGELPPKESAAIARHVESCGFCSRRCSSLRDVSSDLQLYCHATFTAAQASPRLPRWVPVSVALAAAAVLAVTILLAFPSKPAMKPAPGPSPVAAAAAFQPLEPHPPSVERKPIHRKRPRSASTKPAAPWPSVDTAVEIAIPADAFFAPGVLPEGTRLFGEMRIGPDGSLREIRLRQ